MPREFLGSGVLSVLHDELINGEVWLVLGDDAGRVAVARIVDPLKVPKSYHPRIEIPILKPVKIGAENGPFDAIERDRADLVEVGVKIGTRHVVLRVGFAPRTKKWVIAC